MKRASAVPGYASVVQDVELRLEAGHLEQALDRPAGLGAEQKLELAVLLRGEPAGGEQHADHRRVDERGLAQVDADTEPLVEKGANRARQFVGGIRLVLASQAEDRAFWLHDDGKVGIHPNENAQVAVRDTVRAMILVVAATPAELLGADGTEQLVCGVGPVEAAARTAAALERRRPTAVLHVGVAGARAFDAPAFVIGSEALYCDADDPAWIELRAPADDGLVAAARRALPDARVEPIGTSARVGGSSGCEVEAMEGYAVLRAAALAGVAAVEVRVLANAVGEPDRGRWRLDEARHALAAELPRLIEEIERA